MKPRNVLILCCDEHARLALGCYGHPLGGRDKVLAPPGFNHTRPGS